MIEGFGGKDSGRRPTPAQMQAAIEASREVLKSGKIPPPDRMRRRPAASTLKKSIRPSSTKGGMTALHHAARQGYMDAARALLDGGANIDEVQRRATAPPRC